MSIMAPDAIPTDVQPEGALTLVDGFMAENLKSGRTIFSYDEIENFLLDLRLLLTPGKSYGENHK